MELNRIYPAGCAFIFLFSDSRTMLSPRRTRVLLLAVFIGSVVILSRRQERTLRADGKDFLSRTPFGIDWTQTLSSDPKSEDGAKAGSTDHLKMDYGDGDINDNDQGALAVAERLREAERKAKDLANRKSPNKPDNPKLLIGVGSSAGRLDAIHEKEDIISEESDGVASIESEPSEMDDFDTATVDEINKIFRMSPGMHVLLPTILLCTSF